jgi:hypothetical protein
MASESLNTFWIKTPFKHYPLGFGVTAYSLEDAIKIIKAWGYELPDDVGILSVREGVTVSALDEPHVVANMGPIVNRGMWYPFVGLGVPRWMGL